MIEYSITVKDSERTLTKRFTSPNSLVVSRNNEELLDTITQVVQEFKGDISIESPDITIKAKMIWQ